MNKTSLSCVVALLAVGLLVGAASAQTVAYVPYGTVDPSSGVTAAVVHAPTMCYWTGTPTSTWGPQTTGGAGSPLTYSLPAQNLDPLRVGIAPGGWAVNWDRQYDTAALTASDYVNGGYTSAAQATPTIDPGHTGALQVVDITFDDAHVGSGNSAYCNWYTPFGNLTFDRTGGFTLNADSTYLAGNVTCIDPTPATPVTYTLSGVSGALQLIGRTGNGWSTTFAPKTFTAGANTTLDITMGGGAPLEFNIGPTTFAGAGTTNIILNNSNAQGAINADTWNFTSGATVNFNAAFNFDVAAVTGSGATANLQNGTYFFDATGYNSSTQANVQGTSIVEFRETGDTNWSAKPDAAAVAGVVNMQLQGSAATLRFTGTDQTFSNAATVIGGDGAINTGTGKLVLQGGTLAPTKTAAGTGVLTVTGNLQFAKSAASVDSILNTGITSTTAFSQLSVTGAVTSASSATNNLADVDLVVNIKPGLSTGVNSTTLGVVGTDPFAGQTPIVLANTGLAAGSAFGKVTFVGGSAKATVTSAGVQLSNIFSNPTLAGDINNDGLVDVADYDIWAANVGMTGATWLQGDLNGDGLVDVADYDIWAANVGATAATPEPISMIILAIGGGLVALKRRNA
jgi:hypothetical protein